MAGSNSTNLNGNFLPLVNFKWSIRNFSMMQQDPLRSPEFRTALYRFCLELHPHGIVPKSGYISVNLIRLEDFGVENVSCMCEMEVVSSKPAETKGPSQVLNISKNQPCSWPELKKRKSLLSIKREVYLPDDILTIKCNLSLASNEVTYNSEGGGTTSFGHLQKLFETGDYSDIVLLVEDQEFHAHRVILESRCPNFLDSLKKLKHPSKFLVEGIKASHLKVLLRYLYTGCIDSANVNNELLSVFQELGLHDLKHLLSHPPFRDIHIISEQPMSIVEFPWVIKDFSRLQPGIELVYPESCIPDSGWNKIELAVTIGEAEDASEEKQSEVLFLKVRKLDGNKVTYLACSVSAKKEPNIITTLYKGKNPWKNKELVRTIKMENVRENLIGDTLHLLCRVGMSKSKVEVKTEKVSAGQLMELNLPLRMQRDFENLVIKNDSKFADVHLRVSEAEFHVHKVFLCSQSPVFERMLQDDFLEKEKGVVVIDDVKPETMSILLQYLYCGMVKDLDIDNAFSLFKAADKYLVLPLVKKCTKLIMSSLDVEHVGEALVLANAHQNLELQSFVFDFIISHPEAVIACPQTLDALRERPECCPNIFLELLKRYPPLD